jgi:homoserine dehydrogenase
MKRPPALPDRNAPLRALTAEECRASGFPAGTEVTATATLDDLVRSAPFKLYRRPDR